MFVAEDATLVEVNPLVKTADGGIIALDAKVTLDDNADFRHPDHAALADNAARRPAGAAAKEKDLNYVKLDGEVGIIGNGAGLVMSTLDVVAYAGEALGGVKPANFLDIGGGAGADVMANGLEIILPTRRCSASSSTSSAASPPATRSPTASCRRSRCSRQRGEAIDQAAGRPARRQQRRGGPADPRRCAHCPLVEQVDTMDGAADARRRAGRGGGATTWRSS